MLPPLPSSPAELVSWLEAALPLLEGLSTLICGDLLLDEYLYGAADRISPEAPVPVVRLTASEMRLGGAGNVARNVAALGGVPHLVGVVGPDATGTDIATLWAAEFGTSAATILTDPERVTPRKTRVLAGTQQLLRLDLEPAQIPETTGWTAMATALESQAAHCQVSLFSDYQKGTLGPRGIPALVAAVTQSGTPVLVNPKPPSAAAFRGATLLSVNRSEALGLLPVDQRPADPLVAGPQLREYLGIDALLITQGAAGMTLFTHEGSWQMPAVASEVFDVAGAGDTVLAALGLATGAGWPLPAGMLLATYAAGVVVRKVGVATPQPAEILALATQRPLIPRWDPRRT